MNWMRLKLTFSNAHVVAIIASFGALVALPTVLQFQVQDLSKKIAYAYGLGTVSLTVEQLLAAQVALVLIAASTYVFSSIFTSIAVPAAIGAHANVSEFVKIKYEAIGAARAAGVSDDALMAMTPGEHWAEDLHRHLPVRAMLTTFLGVSLAAFALGFVCSFLLLQAAVLL